MSQGNALSRPLRVEYHPGMGNRGTDEILRPTLMSTSHGGCYRLVIDTFGRRSDYEAAKYDDDGTVDRFQDDIYDEGNDPLADLEGLERTPGGGYMLPLPIPSVFFKYIIGSKGATRMTIEKDTKCFLRIPRRNQEGNIIIEGETVSAIAHAKRRVEMVAWSNRFKEEPTHFISIPLTAPHIMEQFKVFTEEVLNKCGQDRTVEKDVFKDPNRLHLTLGVLRIFSQEEEDKAVRVFEQSVTDAKVHLDSRPAVISLQGLDTMSDDISASRVIFSKVKLTDSSDRLQRFVDEIQAKFIQEAPELMRMEFGRIGVKLHATLINSKFLEVDKDAELEVHRGRRRYRQKKTVDATGIFKHFKDFNFGEIPLTSVHLSVRFEDDQDSGYYKCVQEYFI